MSKYEAGHGKCKKSFKEDIESGFQIIHIDTCIDIHENIKFSNAIDRACELIEFAWQTSKELKKEILFEIGTEEQSGLEILIKWVRHL